MRKTIIPTLIAGSLLLASPAWSADDHGEKPAKAVRKPAVEPDEPADKPLEARRSSKSKAKDSMTSDEAIEQLSAKIAEKLAAMKPASDRPGDKRPDDKRLIVQNRGTVAAAAAGAAPAGHAAPAGQPAAPRPAMVRTTYQAEHLPMAAAATGGMSNQVDAAALANTYRRSVRPATGPAPADPHAAAGASAAAQGAGHVHWAYTGEAGPENWGRLKPEFAKCAAGARQSPIDIREGIKVDLEPISFDYKPGGFRVIDNGHTVQVNVAAGSGLTVNGRRFELVQFHFHRPSEERVNGRQYDMVAHLVHKDNDGKLAVVAVLIERGSVQPVIQTVWNNLPLEQGEEVAAQQAIDLTQMLPQDRAYFTYMGSLTTPPCSEGVLWMVLKQPVQVSAEQIAIFSRLYPMNARPVQTASGRLIKESN